MKKLYLFRHAKSSWDYPELDDFERPLNKRGRSDLPIIGNVLKQLDIKPDLILASPATRAAMTARHITEYLNTDIANLRFDVTIYEASASSLLKILQQIPNKFERVMLVGHNPALTSLANMLVNNQISNIPTAGCYAIEFNLSDWSQLKEKAGRSSFFEFPRKHKNK
jgi:phosphohistidine phosphatase